MDNVFISLVIITVMSMSWWSNKLTAADVLWMRWDSLFWLIVSRSIVQVDNWFVDQSLSPSTVRITRPPAGLLDPALRYKHNAQVWSLNLPTLCPTEAQTIWSLKTKTFGLTADRVLLDDQRKLSRMPQNWICSSNSRLPTKILHKSGLSSSRCI